MTNVLIIGGGPAGSLAAILLARRGVAVTLVEQARFPRDKVCGECLSALGVAVLTRHGLVTELHQRGAIGLTRAMLHAPAGHSCELLLPHPMLGVSRSMLDAYLLNEARAAGANVVQPARCESLQPTADGVLCTVRSLVDTSVHTLHADVALLADGKGKLLDDAAPPTGDFGIKAHFTGIDAPPNAIELFGVNGHYGGLSAVEGNRWNSSFAVPAARLKACGGDLDRLFAQIVSENAVLSRRFAHAQRSGDWHCSPLPRFGVARRWPKNVIPLGNAAAAIEPIGGEGMGLALRSAELAVTALLSGSFDPTNLRDEYRRLWSARRLACRAAGMVMSSPTASRWAIACVDQDSPLTPWILRWVGKMSA